MIKENIAYVNKSIKDACNKVGRNFDDVKLIAVSKTKPVSMMHEAYETGIRDFGENKVQEIVKKYEEMPDDTRFHMIGHLQTNKVKMLVDKVYMIHSVDSLHLAEVISKEAKKVNKVIPVLIEVNVAEEESKYGVKVNECEDLIRSCSVLPGIKVKGLMTIAPYVENGEENRKYFQALRQLSVDIMQKNIDNVSMEFLSMGMSGDYEVAAQEGATFVRVGTGIFGEREYQLKE